MKQFINFGDTTMPFTDAQIATGANYALEAYSRENPTDQINTQHVTLDWLIGKKDPVIFGNGFYNEDVYIDNGSNYQNYFGADQVSYNERDPVKQAPFGYANYHDGFWFDEDRLAANGIVMTDDSSDGNMPTGAEKVQLVNLLKTSYDALKNGTQANLALELLQDGSQSSKAVAGLDHLIATDPTNDTVGGLDSSVITSWRNNFDLGITAANVVDEMEIMWRACMQYGQMGVPDKIICGSAFLDNYRTQAGTTINRQIIVKEKGGTGLDASTSGLFFKGIPLEWDPDFEALDTLLGAITYPWTKRCYFLNSKTIKLRPFKGHWMVKRNPERLPDRYVYYFGQTSKYGMTCKKRNSNAVLSIA